MASLNFDGIEKAKVSQNGTYLLAGQYRLKVVRIIGKDSFNSGPVFVAEFEILKSNNPERLAGSRASYVIKMTGNPSCLPNLKGFLGPLYGIPLSREAEIDQEITTEFCNFVISGTGDNEGKVAAGKEVMCECSMTKTKKGGDFTKHSFSPAV